MSLVQSQPSYNPSSQVSKRPASSEGVSHVRLVGDQDASTADALSVRLDEIIDHSGDDLVLDLTDVTFIDSATAQVLLSVRDRLDRKGNQLKLLAPPPNIGRILKLCGMSGLISHDVTFPRGETGVHRVRLYVKTPKFGENTQ